jgi:hypothetical protein
MTSGTARVAMIGIRRPVGTARSGPPSNSCSTVSVGSTESHTSIAIRCRDSCATSFIGTSSQFQCLIPTVPPPGLKVQDMIDMALYKESLWKRTSSAT